MSDVDTQQRINCLEDRVTEQDFEIEKLNAELIDQREGLIKMMKAVISDLDELRERKQDKAYF